MSESFVGIFCRVMLAELEIVCLCCSVCPSILQPSSTVDGHPACHLQRRRKAFLSTSQKKACLFHLTSFLEASTSYISLFRALHSCFWCLSSLLKTSGRVAHSSDNYSYHRLIRGPSGRALISPFDSEFTRSRTSRRRKYKF